MPAKRKSRIRYVAFTAVGLVFLFAFEYLGLFQGVDNYLYDLFFRIRGSRDPGSNVVIVAVDEKALERLGKWPVSRRVYETLLERLHEAEAVLFDVIFAEPSIDDAPFRAAIDRHGRVVLSAYVEGGLRIAKPSESLGEPRTGHVHVGQDVDGVVRSVFHTLYLRGAPLPSAASVVSEVVVGRPYARTPPPSVSPTQGGYLFQQDLRRVNYYGPPGLLRRLSLADVIAGVYPDAFFRNRVVLVGVTAAGLESEVLTPFAQAGNRSPGVEVQATILSNILEGDGLTDMREWLRIPICVLLAVLFSFLFVRLNEKMNLLGFALGLLGLTVSVFLLFALFRVWSGPTLFYSALTLVFLTSYLMRLDSAAELLDASYGRALHNLRWRADRVERPGSEKGLSSLLSTGGIQSRIEMLEEIISQLLVEKNMVDATLLSGVHGVLLFGPSGPPVLANDRAREFLAGIVNESDSSEQVVAKLLPLALDEAPGSKLSLAYGGDGAVSLTLALTEPKMAFLKTDVTTVLLGQEKHHLFVFSDITEIKELELRKGDLVNIVSHELKQPLTVLLGYSELLLMRRGEGGEEYARKINEEAVRMSGLINTFLDLSRIEAGRQEIRRKVVNAAHLASEAVERLKPLAASKGIGVDVRCPSVMEVTADRDLLLQCLVNLVENALKYSPPGARVSVQMMEADGQSRISVIDNGFGIDRAELPHIFDKFHRVRTEQTRSVSGTGLGLAFVKQAIQAMGGTVSVESVVEKGSTFLIVFQK